MDILVNGQHGIAETENDVTLGRLFAYLRQEFAKQSLVVRAFKLDGADVTDVMERELAEQSPADYGKLEVEVGNFDVVAHDVLNELKEKMPALAAEAVAITEQLQTGDVSQAHERLRVFNETVLYVAEALNSIRQLSTIDLKTLSDDTLDISALFSELGKHLGELNTSIEERDYATIGDILEFDLSPQIGRIGEVMDRMCRELETRANNKDGSGTSTSGDA